MLLGVGQVIFLFCFRRRRTVFTGGCTAAAVLLIVVRTAFGNQFWSVHI